MIHEQAVMLARYVRAICPQQKFDEYTPDAWFDLLGDQDYETCKTAAAALGRVQPFIAPAEIIAMVRMGRRSRLESFQYDVGDSDPDETPREYLRRLRAQIADVADGRRPAELNQVGAHPDLVGELLADVIHPVDGDPTWT